MLFKLKKGCGQHVEKGRTYKAGEEVESEHDLVRMFPEKFELVPGQISVPAVPEIPAPITVKGSVDSENERPTLPKSTSDEDEKPKKKTKGSKHGKDVTDDFPTAEGFGFKIYEKGGWFAVVDANDGAVINKKKLRKDGVETFLEEYDMGDEDEEEDGKGEYPSHSNSLL